MEIINNGFMFELERYLWQLGKDKFPKKYYR